jgi:hypothetical protein
MSRRAYETMKVYVDLEAMSKWLMNQYPELKMTNTGQTYSISVGATPVIEGIKASVPGKIFNDDLKMLAMMSKHTAPTPHTERLIGLIQSYALAMQHMARMSSVWEISEKLARVDPLIKVTVDIPHIEKGYGPKGKGISTVPFLFNGAAVFSIICTGDIPRVVCPLYRAAEAVMLSSLSLEQQMACFKALAQ